MAMQMQAAYPAQMAACVTAARGAARIVLPPSAARAAQPFLTARTLCYGVSGACAASAHQHVVSRKSPVPLASHDCRFEYFRAA